MPLSKGYYSMSGQKMRGAFLLFLLVLLAVPLAGCRSGEDFPIYQMESREDDTEILYIDGIQYQRDMCADWDELAHYYSDGDQYAWTPAEGIGEQIGVYGKDVDKGYGFAIYEIAGDEARTFLYTAPRKFYTGGVETRLWMQDGVTLGTPTAEMVSSVTIVIENQEEHTPVQVDDPAMIAALLEAYSGDSLEVPDSGDWEFGFLIMHHRDFPFLQYEIEYRCSPELEISYCRNKKREWLLLPAEWYAVISGCGLPAQDE